MCRRRFALLLPLLTAAWLWWSPAWAINTDGAVGHVQQLADQALVTLRRADMTVAQREAALRPLFNHSFDLDFIGRFALGKTWVRATPEQRADYMELIREFVVKTTAKRLGGFVAESFTIIRVKEISDGDVLVVSRVESLGESPVVAGWRVRQVGGDQHKIIDVSVGGLSLSQAHRRNFAVLIQQARYRWPCCGFYGPASAACPSRPIEDRRAGAAVSLSSGATGLGVST